MNNKSNRFKLIITKIIDQLNAIISEINTQLKKQNSLFVHTITIKLNTDKRTLNFFLNSNLVPSSEIKIDTIYFQEILKKLNEVLNKMHFFNCHIRIIIIEEQSLLNYLELQSKYLTLPNFSQIVQNFSDFYEKKLDKDNTIYLLLN